MQFMILDWILALVLPHVGISTGLLEHPSTMAAGFSQSG